MQININILTKIINQLALNKWKTRVRKINRQYHTIFSRIHGSLRASLGICKKCSPKCKRDFVYNYRYSESDKNVIYHNTFIPCYICKRKVCSIESFTFCYYPGYKGPPINGHK